MAMIKFLGDIPVIGKVFNYPWYGQNLWWDAGVSYQDVYDALEDITGSSSKAVWAQQIPSISKYLGTGWALGSDLIGSVMYSVPLKHKDIFNPPQDTTIIVKDIAGAAQGTGNFRILANPQLHTAEYDTGVTYSEDHPDLWNVYMFGLEVYTDALGANLAGICVVVGNVYLDQGGEYFFDVHGSTLMLNTPKMDLAGYDMDMPEIDPDYGTPSEPQGYGQDDIPPAHDHSSDTIPVPDDPTVSSHTAGLLHVYKVGAGALASIGQYLFPDLSNIASWDLTETMRAIAGIFGYRDNIQYIVDLHAIPVEPTVGNSDYIKIGTLSTDVSQPVCTSDYVNFDCGTIELAENEKNYLDFICEAKLFLPFVGFVPINPEYWNGGKLQVKYKFNIIDGSFMAYVIASSGKSKLRNTVIGQYSGSACMHLPVVAASYGSIASGLVSGSMAIAAGAASGNAAGVISGAMTASNFQPKMSQSNNYNASSAYLGVRKPYLLIERPVPCFSTSYRHEQGLPLNVTRIIGTMTGFTQIEDIDLSGFGTATQAEKDEIKALLSAGVYL